MKHRTLLFSLGVLIATALPSDGAEPFLGYATSLAQREAIRSPDYWEGARGGGYLFRFQLDVSGDGRPELFLTSSLDTFRMKSAWKVYQVTDIAKPQEYPGTLNLNLCGFLLARQPDKTTLFDMRGTPLEYRLRRYDFSSAALEASEGVISEADYQALIRAVEEGTLKEVSPQIEAISLYDIATDPDAEWFSINSMEIVNGSDFVEIPGRLVPPDSFTARTAFELLSEKASQLRPPRLSLQSQPAGAAAAGRKHFARPQLGWKREVYRGKPSRRIR